MFYNVYGRTLLLLLESKQRSKKVVSYSPGLVDFAIELVNFELNLPDGQVTFFEEFKLKKNCEINSAHQNVFRTRLRRLSLPTCKFNTC